MPTEKRSHQNDKRRLTAKERASALMSALFSSTGLLQSPSVLIEAALQAHAREAVARHRRRHAAAWDAMLAKGAGK